MKAASDNGACTGETDAIGQDLPAIELHDPADASLQILHGLQKAVLKHPAAAQAIFSALIAEGRAFARTPEGERWERQLARSRLLQQAGLVFDLATLSTLEETPPGPLPSTYFDVLFMLAGNPASDAILHQLFNPGEHGL